MKNSDRCSSMRILLFSIILILFASCKKYSEKSLILIRDCTATYVRDGDVDLPIFNFNELAGIDSGEVVQIRYYFINTKKGKPAFLNECEEPHSFPIGDWIEVEE